MLLLVLCLSFVHVEAYGIFTNNKIEYTNKWLSTKQYMFKDMFFNESQIMGFEGRPNYINGVQAATILTKKTFWTKTVTPNACQSWNWWIKWPQLSTNYETQSLKHYRRSGCCSTNFNATAPITIQYRGKAYDVYHPPDGWQIIYTGDCPNEATCSGTCKPEMDYNTWVLVLDLELNNIPAIRFVPLSYSRYCKCVNSS